MIEALGLAVAIAAAYFAWRANSKSDNANEIATKALAISEREEAARLADRKARARLSVSVGLVGYTPDTGGILRLTGSGGQLRLAITIRNDEGDRDAGRTKVEAIFPLIVNDSYTRWSDASGRPLPDYPLTATRIGETNVLERTLDAVSRGVSESLFAAFPVSVPNGDYLNDYSINVRVVAEGAEPREIVEDFPLRIGRDPTP
jgi:hypothetical protein